MKAFRELLLGAAAGHALSMAIAASVLAPVVAHAGDAMPIITPMDHGTAMGDSAPPPPATLTWVMMAPAGEFMLNYNPTFMGMAGNYIGDKKVSDAYIGTNVPSGMTMMMKGMGGVMKPMSVPERVIPSTMDMQMHMFNAMYGVTDSINVMAMTGYVEKSMSMITYASPMMSPSNLTKFLGTSSGTTEGLSDTMVGASYKLYQDATSRVIIGLNLSLPTGSQTRQITMLSPMNMFITMRAPYGMQIGSGTVDLLPSIAYTGHLGLWSWGLGYRGRFALDNNSEGYRFGDLHELHGWGGYIVLPGVTTTLHVVGSTQDHIHGSDPVIAAMTMSQNMNPDYYGGQRVTLLGGIELSGAPWGYGKSALALEAGGPIYQNLDGPQLGQAWQVSLSGRLMF